jgi:hypothetical protein
MPEHQHCPPAKSRDDKNPKYHGEQEKDVARFLAAHPSKKRRKETKTPKRNKSKSTKEMLHADIIVKTQPCQGSDELPQK